MLLRLLYLGLVGIHLSNQDLVTSAPSRSVDEATTSPQAPQKTKLKPKIRSLHITSDIKYRYATTLVSTRVVNPDDEPGEAVFTITLPESAFISDFLMEIKDEVYKAYVKEKEEAKAVYFEAVQGGQFAGHIAQDDTRDSNSFTVSVNIEAHGKVTFNLTYEQLLSRNLGLYHNIINLNPNQIVEDMSVKVNIEEPTEITHLEVPELQESNNIVEDDVKENKLAKIVIKSPNHKTVSWAPTPEEQKRQKNDGVSGQFIVKYDVDRSKNPQQILVDEGYFVHFFAPENLPKLKKHVSFILDYSGSMEGQKLEQLQDAMKKILTDLEPADSFSIVIFHTYGVAWSPTKTYTTSVEHHLSSSLKENNSTSNNLLDHEYVVEASSENIDLALSYLKNYSLLGATNIMAGLRTGLQLVEISQKQLREDPPQPIVIFLTDGLPNEEVYDTEEIVTKTKSLNTRGCPIFSLAFGSDADFNFLRKLSLKNFGFARNIYEAADAPAQLKNFYGTVASPLFSNVTFSYLPGQVDNTSSTKQEFPTFFRGSEIVVAGKFDNEAVKDTTTIGELSGVSSDGLRTYPIVVDQDNETHSFGHLEKTWAYLTIQQLLDKVDSLDEGVEKTETKAKALELALKYSFVTRLTSLVVVKPNETTSDVNIKRLNPGPEEDSFDLIDIRVESEEFVFEPMKMSFGDLDSSTYYFNPDDFSTGPPVPTESIQEVTEQVSQDNEPAPAPHKVALDDIKWLQPLNSTVTLEGKNYNLGQNVTDTSFGKCTVKGEDGECRHIQFCALEVFQNEISQFTPYQCHIAGDFLGVCCPKNVL